MDDPVAFSLLAIAAFAVTAYLAVTLLRSSPGEVEMAMGRDGVRLRVSTLDRNAAAEEANRSSVRTDRTASRVGSLLDDIDEVDEIRCLWVDDNPEWTIHERRMLERIGLRFDLARSTKEALQHLLGSSYDLLITDLGRDEGNGLDARAGIELLEILVEATKQPPVVVYCGDLDDRVAVASGLGAIAVVNAPEDLLEVVLRLQG